ncbi:NACHT domain-containing protein [Micromonospora krabiensis]|uniref:AAA ATPase domain n=1 Tax=Micromonospora krabiensis TaxID=307121 RepID=A0A1C3NCV6_9ACTN|nr:hypothetical protein [Micromonospora krabiensis]SBV30379.1 AAA ATPase domain [Micromonospora krabiensis]
MPDALGYADAVRLLGGEQSRLVDRFDKLTTGALLVAAVPVPALLGIFDARAEFVRLGHELVRGASEKRSGLSRYGRTQRLAAAHAVIAVTAFFEQLGELDLPFDVGGLKIGRSEQLGMAGARPADDLTAALFSTGAPVPGPHLPYPELRSALVGYYETLVTTFLSFLRGLAIADTLYDRRWRATEQALARLPLSAADRHRDLLTRLAADFPEVSLWLQLDAHEATRQEVHRLSLGLAEMRRTLRDLSTGRAPDARRQALGAAYAAELRRPVIPSGDVPAGLSVPTLGEAYVPPLCRIAELGPDARPSEERWWAHRPVRDDLWQSLVVHLTSSGATRAPLLVLGQPGSGKSVLTRVLAAQLPAADFLVVRVTLRDVYAAGDLQDQIEQAVRNDTGERLDWPTLSRSAGDALPVVVLDGFDELLQATGVSQTDYLRRVAAFQHREADQSRPVAVLVTSRTSVADRAQPPPGTIAIRLEPFDEARVGAWVETWNRVNRAAFRAPGARPLDREIVLSHRELAEQPLLLLMLALYDAEGGDLREAGELRRGDLYERLLRRFARREVVKQRDGLPEPELDRAVEEELRRLAVVAFAMFNRGVQWVTTTELDGDLAALPLAGAPARERSGLRTPLAPAEVVLGRFFFIHRSRASSDERRRETYEFLHATFGEYLVARLTVQVVDDLVARDAAASLSWGGGPLDDDLLHALLSYAVLSTRSTVLAFLGEWLAGRAVEQRDAWFDLLLRLFREVPYAAGARRFDDYRPRRLRVPARYAAYGANLLLLVLAAGGMVTSRQLFPEAADPVAEWRAQVGLWRAQLDPEEWKSLSDLLALERLGAGGARDIRLWTHYRLGAPPETDVPWLLGLPPGRPGSGWGLSGDTLARLRRNAHLTCDVDSGVVVHAVEPLFDKLASALGVFSTGTGAPASAARALVDAWLLPLRAATERERREVYLRCARLVTDVSGVVPEWDRAAFLRLLFDRLAADRTASPELVAEVLSACQVELLKEPATRFALMRCAQRALGANEVTDLRLAQIVNPLMRDNAGQFDVPLDDVTASVLARLHERGLAEPFLTPGLLAGFEDRYGRQHPDLVRRLGPLVRDFVGQPGKRRQDGVADAVEAGS